MSVEEREVSCPCGHRYLSSLATNWCPKCGKRIYNSDKERRRHKVNTFYFYGVSLLALSALAYFFVELIFIPIMKISVQ